MTVSLILYWVSFCNPPRMALVELSRLPSLDMKISYNDLVTLRCYIKTYPSRTSAFSSFIRVSSNPDNLLLKIL
jgi:hypothetical protein